MVVAASSVAVTLLFLLAGCGGSASSASNSTASPQVAAKPEPKAKTPAEKQAEARAAMKRRDQKKREEQRNRLEAEKTLKEEEAAHQAERRHTREEARKAQKARENRPQHNEARACGSYSGKDSFACEDSYEICSLEAPSVVEKAYHEEGPSFDSWAMHYAKETYTGHANSFEDIVWEAGYAGCLEAMYGEYEKLYG